MIPGEGTQADVDRRVTRIWDYSQEDSETAWMSGVVCRCAWFPDSDVAGFSQAISQRPVIGGGYIIFHVDFFGYDLTKIYCGFTESQLNGQCRIA